MNNCISVIIYLFYVVFSDCFLHFFKKMVMLGFELRALSM
jgi:hypothetical protein